MMKKWVVLSVFLAAACAHAAVSDFENFILAPESHWGGAGSAETGFISGDAYFPHHADDWSWDGFVYSNETDNTTPGYMNQFSAITGGGVEDSNNYSVASIALDWMGGTYDPIPQALSFEANTEVAGVYLTNTTYTYLSMRDGEFVAKKFGGADGTDPDYLRLLISGIDEYNQVTGTVTFYLADFRSPDSAVDYIVDQWTWCDLSSLGAVAAVEFTIESSDVGMFGINTPTYFAMDDLTTVPQPVEVLVDIKPGSNDNPVNVAGKGVLPVLVSGLESFNIEDIDIDSLRLQGIAPLRSDVEADGYSLILKFDVQEMVTALGEVSDGQVWQLDLTGSLEDGTAIQGCDTILIKDKGSK